MVQLDSSSHCGCGISLELRWLYNCSVYLLPTDQDIEAHGCCQGRCDLL